MWCDSPAPSLLHVQAERATGEELASLLICSGCCQEGGHGEVPLPGAHGPGLLGVDKPGPGLRGGVKERMAEGEGASWSQAQQNQCEQGPRVTMHLPQTTVSAMLASCSLVCAGMF